MEGVKEMTKKDNIERLKGTLPKVGIRPIIDGRRRGVREELEPVVMEWPIGSGIHFTEFKISQRTACRMCCSRYPHRKCGGSCGLCV